MIDMGKIEIVSYVFNANSDPTSLAIKGYLVKYKKQIEKEGGFILKDRHENARHIPQSELISFFDKECRKYLTYRDGSGYFTTYQIELNQLKSASKCSVFLQIILDAYINKDLAAQIGRFYFCN